MKWQKTSRKEYDIGINQKYIRCNNIEILKKFEPHIGMKKNQDFIEDSALAVLVVRMPLSNASMFTPLCLRSVLYRSGIAGHRLREFSRVNATTDTPKNLRQDAYF